MNQLTRSLKLRCNSTLVLVFALSAVHCKRNEEETSVEPPSTIAAQNTGNPNAPVPINPAITQPTAPNVVAPTAPTTPTTPAAPAAPAINDGPLVNPGDEPWVALATQLRSQLLGEALPLVAAGRLRPFLTGPFAETHLFIRFVPTRGGRYVGVMVSVLANGKVRYDEVSTPAPVAWYLPGPQLTAEEESAVPELVSVARRVRTALEDPTCPLPWIAENETAHRYTGNPASNASVWCSRARPALRGLKLGSQLGVTLWYGTDRSNARAVNADFAWRDGRWAVTNIH